MLRVTSPGGSYVASDAIWREVVSARETGKPVVVSMGDVAASGGYFVAMGADRIVAEPGTITGSIGVVAGKQVVDDLADRIGLSHDHVAEGDHALMFSPFNRFSESEWDRLNAWLDRIYADFTTKVAEGRRLPVERVHEIARGRVWTGCRRQGARTGRRARRSRPRHRGGEGAGRARAVRPAHHPRLPARPDGGPAPSPSVERGPGRGRRCGSGSRRGAASPAWRPRSDCPCPAR